MADLEESINTFVKTPALPSEGNPSDAGICKYVFLWKKVFIVLGLVTAIIVALRWRSSNTLTLGPGNYQYRIQQRYSLFSDSKNSGSIGIFRRFPSLTLCSNEINSTACPTPYEACTPDPSILELENCQIIRFVDSRYHVEPCPADWKNVTPIASAFQRYCITINGDDDPGTGWRANHPTDQLRIFLRAAEVRSYFTPWSGGFVYLHSAHLTSSPTSIFKLDNSRTHFSVGKYHRLFYDVKIDFTVNDNLDSFTKCKDSASEVEYDLFVRETAALAGAPRQQNDSADDVFQNSSSLTVLSISLHGENPELVCSFNQDLNGFSEVLEHLAGLLVIPELAALAILWLYVVVYKIFIRYSCNSSNCCSCDEDGQAAWCSFAFALIVLFATLAVLLIAFLPQ